MDSARDLSKESSNIKNKSQSLYALVRSRSTSSRSACPTLTRASPRQSIAKSIELMLRMNSAETRAVSSWVRFVCCCYCCYYMTCWFVLARDRRAIRGHTHHHSTPHTDLDMLGPKGIDKVLEAPILPCQPQERKRLCRRGGHGPSGRRVLLPPVVPARGTSSGGCAGDVECSTAAASALVMVLHMGVALGVRWTPAFHVQDRFSCLLQGMARHLLCGVV